MSPSVWCLRREAPSEFWGSPGFGPDSLIISRTAPVRKRGMLYLVVLIYVIVILWFVGTTAFIVRAWTRRRYPHKSPSDLHYIAAGSALLVSAGAGVFVASQIVLALGYARWVG